MLLGSIFSKAQNAQANVAPEPTSSSLQNYVNSSVSPATGIPAINIPLYQLETTAADFPVSLSLSYHPYNAKATVPASEVGLGWSIFKGAVITKESFSRSNEFTEIDLLTKKKADCFYYSIPGHSGKFQIYKDSLTNNLKVHLFTGEKVKIDFTRDLNSTKLIVNSFKITDDKGFQYLFDNYNVNHFVENGYKHQRTSYVVTEVRDASNHPLVTYTYDIKTRNISSSSSNMKYKLCKLSTISTAKGKIKFEYSYDAFLDNNNDQNNEFYTLTGISLQDHSGSVISGYRFIKGSVATYVADFNTLDIDVTDGFKNALQELRKTDKNGAVVESTKFGYNTDGSSTPYGYFTDGNFYGNYICPPDNPFVSPQKEMLGLLYSITFPTGGSVVYDFESNEIYSDRSGDDYTNSNTLTEPLIQYYDPAAIDFDTNITRSYSFTVNGLPNIKYPVQVSKALNENDADYQLVDVHGVPYTFSYSVQNSLNQNMTVENASCNSELSKYFQLYPGTYTLKINSWGGKGSFIAYQLKSIPKPYKNSAPVRVGARIRKITYRDHLNTVQKERIYDYASFTDALSGSGFLFYDQNNITFNGFEGTVVYRNVREKEVSGTQNNGYTDYYFNTPDDYMDTADPFYSKYFNLTSNGILTKKKTYNAQNQLLENVEYEYEFQDIPGTEKNTAGLFFSTPAWVKYIKETTTVKRGQSDYTTVNESFCSPDNFQQISSKVTTPDGDVQETSVKYAQDLSDTRLINANIISVPLQTVVKNNGAAVSGSKINYADPAHFYPSSAETSDLNQVYERQITFDIYDDKGNLAQSTDKAGLAVTTIWGYHKTLPIARITGAKYSDISSLPVVASAVAASDADADDPANEGALLAALENLRLDAILKQYPVSVSAYDPLIGITHSITANGIKMTYEYDAVGRLRTVKDSNGKVVKENLYNYKN